MLWNYSNYVCWGIAWLILIITAMIILCTALAYVANSRRPADDPDKRDYHPMGIILAPVTFPVLLSLAAITLALRALLFAMLLITFVVSLLLWRRPEEPLWIEKVLISIGNRLLKVNTYFIKLAFGQ